jgi:TonB family protein
MARMLARTGPTAEHRVWVSILVLQSILPACTTLPWDGMRKLFNFFGNAHPSRDTQVSVIMGPGTRLGALHVSQTLLILILVLYGVLCAYSAARFLWRCGRLAKLRAESSAISLGLEASNVSTRCAKQFGIEHVSFGTSPQIFAPITFGFVRKLVLLPAGMMDRLPEADLYTVIAHEFAHLRRNDFLKNLLYESLALPVSYHPLCSRTRERLTETREMVCDQMVSAISGSDEYARSLLRLASLLLVGPSLRTPHAIGIFDANTLERRLMRLTERKNETRRARRFAIAAACVLIAAGTCASAVALATNVDGLVATAGDSPKSKGPHTVPASDMVKYLFHKVPPVYPEEAKKERIQGKVVLEAIIGKDGTIENLEVMSGPNELQQSALDAVRQWTYKPFLVDGEPVEVKTTVNVIYKLAD